MRVMTKFRQPDNKSPICLSQVPLQTEIGYQKVLLPINHKNYNFWKQNKQVMKERENLHPKTNKGGANCVMVVISWFNLQIWMWLVDSNHNLESDWLIELSDKKLSDNKLFDNKLSTNKRSGNNVASGLAENRSFSPITIEKIVISMIKDIHEKNYSVWWVEINSVFR